ncbi:DUF4279 domain-containing protein [Fundidesulfovibrio soli]|uniref:DUF4279 domain-containing protein n=1 Tax=Fundidesulfovibrio soli TaxID=2922716 RepID=UPI001FAF1501|nr:DUF4279 domain-containing protein [Fundidesulfovibrio soli]
MNPFKFSVSLRFWSKSIDCIEIANVILLQPDISHKAGEQRKTPKGTLLDGIYKENYCVFRIERQDDEDLSELLERIADDLLPYKDLFDRVRDEGGVAEFFIGWFTSGNSGDIFNHQLLQKLGELSIDLSFDVYGD